MKKYIASLATAMLAISPMAAQEMVEMMSVVGTDGTKTSIARNNIKEVRFEEMPTYQDCNIMLGALYSTNNGKANYYFEITNNTPDENGDPAELGDVQLAVMLTAEPSTEAIDAVIPAGYYRAGSGSVIGTFDINGSAIWAREAEVEMEQIIGGSVDVRVEGNNYDIRCEFTTLSGSRPFYLRYRGPIKFSLGASEYTEFEENQNVTFTNGQGRFYGNWWYPFADDLSLQFYSGSFEGSTQIEGYWLNVSLYAPKSDNPMNPNIKVADGVYKVESREQVPYYTNLPNTFIAGKDVDLMGQILQTDTYLSYIDRSGQRKFGYVKGGTITVSQNGSKFDFDLVLENGKTLKGSCSNMTLVNKCDVDKAGIQRPFSSITADVTLEFPANARCDAYKMGDYIIGGLNNYIVMLGDPSESKPTKDFIMLELISSGSEIADGTYQINNSLTDKSAISGYLLPPNGDAEFCWYGDYDSADAEGYLEVMGPLNGGTVTITSAADGQRTLTIDAVDDNNHKVKGSWTGKFNMHDVTSVAKKLKVKSAEKAVKAPAPVEMHKLVK